MATRNKIVRKRTTESLLVTLSESERNQAGRDLADAEMRRMRRKEVFELARSAWKDDDKVLEAECIRFARMASTGQEEREVPVTVEYDYASAMVRFVRSDNGDDARPPRPMTFEERQMPLSDDEETIN
jgi:hypothetical protein